MATLNGATGRSRRHTHASSAEEFHCPYCGSVLRSTTVLARIRQIEGEVEQTLKNRFAREQQQAIAKAEAEIEKARREAAALIAKTKRDAASREASIRQEAAKAAIAALTPKIAEAVNAEKQRAYAEKLKLTEQLDEMKRRLEQRRANELGDEAEVNLYEALQREFPGDQIARVPRGQGGADILHDVVHQGVVVGRLVLDAKNHSRWSNRFISQIASNLITHRGEHAIVASTVMPAEFRQPFHLVEGVIVAQPARVVGLVTLLRRHVIATHLLRLRNSKADEKRDELYSFISSDRCQHLLDQISALTNHLSELDAKEESSHRTVWKRRSELTRSIHTVHSEFTAEIDQIIVGTISEPPS